MDLFDVDVVDGLYAGIRWAACQDEDGRSHTSYRCKSWAL